MATPFLNLERRSVNPKRMSKAGKITLGILTFVPYLLMGIYLITMTFFLHDAPTVQYRAIPFPLMTDVVWMLFILLIAGILSFGLLVYYIVHAINNPELGTQEKISWVLFMVIISGVTCPLYWYSRIWKAHDTLYMAAS